MPKGVLYVETRPTSPDLDDEYNAWYDDVHLPEVCALDGFVGATRLVPISADGFYVALYQIEGADLQTIVEDMMKHAIQGGFHMSEALQMDPPPVVRILLTTTEYP